MIGPCTASVIAFHLIYHVSVLSKYFKCTKNTLFPLLIVTSDFTYVSPSRFK